MYLAMQALRRRVGSGGSGNLQCSKAVLEILAGGKDTPKSLLCAFQLRSWGGAGHSWLRGWRAWLRGTC